ncbi:hypothetical protein CF326_g1849 [Tilletia indica]|nr:hypothetical protein CF326_g1849 [Tilletia indica]
MASGWLPWGSDPFAELVEKATSELLPPHHEDVALNLEICDQIRAKQVQPKHAAQTIKRRLAHSNPNVVLLTLGLTDICIKNSGDHFLAEVGSKEFMDNFVTVLTSSSGPGKNVDVRNKLLRLIQSWAQVADARPTQMSYVTSTYADLKRRGFPFPPPEPSHVVSAALIETLTAPEWIDGDVCLRCRQPFTTFTRKHHCRNCGNVFCHACSSNTMALPWFGIGQDVRVCDGCHASRGPPSNARRAKPAPAPAPKTNDHVSSSSSLARSATVGAASVRSSGRGGVGNAYVAPQRSNTITASSSGSRKKKEEDEIALAIQLSLQSSSSPSAGYIPSAPPASSGLTPRSPARGPSGRMGEGTDTMGEEDAELAAAIAASLRDYSVPQPSAPSGFSDVASIASMPVTPAPQSEASIYDGGGYLSNGYGANGAAEYYRQQQHQQQQAQTAPPPPAPQSTLPLPPSIELPSQDIDSLMSFSQTVIRAEESAAQTPNHPYSLQQLHQTISDPTTQGLYDRAQLARPKMARSLDEAGRRHGALVGMHEKLTEAVKLYNRLLDAQMGRGPQIVYSQQQQSQQAPPQQVRRETEYAQQQGSYGQVQSPAPASAPAQQNGLYPSLPPSSTPGPTSPQQLHHQQHAYGSMYAAQQSPVASFPPAHAYQGGPPPSEAPWNAQQAQYAQQGYGYGPGQGQVGGAPPAHVPQHVSQTYGVGAHVQSPAQYDAQLPPVGQYETQQSTVGQQGVNHASASAAGAIVSAPSAPSWLPTTSAAQFPMSPSAPPQAPQQAQSLVPVATGASSSTFGFGPGGPGYASAPPPSFGDEVPTTGLEGGLGSMSVGGPPGGGGGQEPWRREVERPLIDL